MPRTTEEQVEAIIEVDPTLELDAFIETASMLVTDVCAPLGYDATRLELIERWLAAHFYSQRDRRLTSEKAGPVSANYESELALGLQNTQHGQQAMLLDFKGGLASLNANTNKGLKVKLGITWLGTSCEERA